MTDEEIDGFTGATPQTGKMTFTWNFTDNNGKKVNKGKFRVCVEATLKNEYKKLYIAAIAGWQKIIYFCGCRCKLRVQ